MSNKLNPFTAIYQSTEYKDAYKLPLRDFPMIIDLETTNRCNLNCVMCPRQIMTRPLGNFDYRIFPQMVKEGKEHGLRGLRFILFGEPTLNPSVASCIVWAHRNGILTHLTTNGTTMTKWKADHFIRGGLDSIVFSFQGTTQAEYEKMRGAPFHNTMRGLYNLIELRKMYGVENPFITCTTTILDETPEQVQAWKDLMLKCGVDAVDVWETNLERVKHKISPELYARQRLSKIDNPHPCNEVYTKMNILYDGTCIACCDDVNGELFMGKFPGESLSTIWHNNQYELLRQNIKMNHYPKVCEQCHSKF